MTEEQTTAGKSTEPLIDIQRPKQPQFDIEHQISRSLEDMRKTGNISKEHLRRHGEFYQKHLAQIFSQLRDQIAKSAQYKDIEPSLQEYIVSKQEFAEEYIDQRARRLIDNEQRAYLSRRLATSITASPPYPNRYQDPDAYGGFGIESFLDPSIGRMGWYLGIPGTGDISVRSGVGAWLYSGANGGIASVRADVSLSGVCREYAPVPLGSYARTIARIHIRTWDANDRLYDAQQTIHDHELFFGLNQENFENNYFSPTLLVPIQPERWYLVWVWGEHYNISFPPGSVAMQQLYIYADRIEISL